GLAEVSEGTPGGWTPGGGRQNAMRTARHDGALLEPRCRFRLPLWACARGSSVVTDSGVSDAAVAARLGPGRTLGVDGPVLDAGASLVWGSLTSLCSRRRKSCARSRGFSSRPWPPPSQWRFRRA